MKQLIPLQVDEHTTIYIEPSEESIATPADSADLQPKTPVQREVTRRDLNLDPKGQTNLLARQAAQSFRVLENTLKAYTKGTLNAFTELGQANVDKVTLEFGVNVGGEMGVPYITKGTADCSLKITVECSFPKDDQKGGQPN